MRRHRRRKVKFRGILGFILLAIIIALLISAVDKAVRPSAEKQSEHISRLTASRIINETVSEYIAENEYNYSDFAAVLYDESGRAASVEALSGNINRVQSELAAAINRRLSDSKETGVKIPLGTLSGSYLFAGRGPSVRLRVSPVGEASVTLKSSFDSAGINQTRHRIYAEISTDMISSIPLYGFETEEKFELLLAETVIVGDVPDYAVRAWSSL